MSIAEKLVTIAENEHKVYNAGKQEGQLSVWNASESLQGNVSGVAISVNDVSPIEHTVECKVASKNLIKTSDVLDGYEILENEIKPNPNWYVVSIDVLPNTKYTVSGFSSGARIEENISGIKTRFFTNDVTFTTLPTTIKLYFNSNKSVYGNNQLELGTTATEYTPYITDFSGVEVSRYGKNLLNFSIAHLYDSNVNKSYYENGILYVDAGSSNSLGVYTDKIYLPTNTPLCYKHKIADAKSDRFVIRCFDENDNNISANINIGWGSYLAYYEGIFGTGANGAKFTLPPEVSYIVLAYCRMSNTDLAQNKYSNLQIEIGSATAYEPYIEPTIYQPTADGIVNGITSISPNMTLLSNNGAVSINAKYYKDPDIVISNLQQAVALTGGE